MFIETGTHLGSRFRCRKDQISTKSNSARASACRAVGFIAQNLAWWKSNQRTGIIQSLRAGAWLTRCSITINKALHENTKRLLESIPRYRKELSTVYQPAYASKPDCDCDSRIPQCEKLLLGQKTGRLTSQDASSWVTLADQLSYRRKANRDANWAKILFAARKGWLFEVYKVLGLCLQLSKSERLFKAAPPTSLYGDTIHQLFKHKRTIQKVQNRQPLIINGAN